MDHAGGIGVEGMAGAIARHAAFLVVPVDALLRHIEAGATGDRHVALQVQQALAGRGDRHQRGRARGGHAHRRPAEAQLVGHARGQVVLVVGDHRLQVSVDGLQVEVVGHIEQVVVEVGARIDAHMAGAAVGHIARVFERMPHHFEEQPVLRVQQAGLARRHLEEFGREVLHALQQVARSRARHLAAAAHVAARADMAPQRVHVVGARKAAGHADDGDRAVQ